MSEHNSVIASSPQYVQGELFFGEVLGAMAGDTVIEASPYSEEPDPDAQTDGWLWATHDG